MNNKVRSILEEAYQLAESSNNTYSALSATQENWIKIIGEKAESQKGVLAVLTTSLTKKIETPTQDVRYHKKGLSNGYSGRVFDTQHITPFIREKFQRFAMQGGSGWLTRSLEQAHPYTLEYRGRILDKAVKEAFLRILHDIEEHQSDPKQYLQALFTVLINLMERSQVNLSLLEETNESSTRHPQSDTITIENIVNLLKYHFSYDYSTSGASRLPVLAVFSAYEMLMSIERYEGKTLSPLKSHTTSDTKSGGIGDIEVLDENANFFEAVEIKHNIPISPDLVQGAYQKFADTSVCRYYLLTTSEPNVDDPSKVDQWVQKIHRQHGCEVIVNGILPSLKYYLRLLRNPKLFLNCYSKNLQGDFNQNTDIKEVHLHHWNELLSNPL